MTDRKLTYADATLDLISALQSTMTLFDGDTIANVDDAWKAYQDAQNEHLHANGGPYPVQGRRGWTWLNDAPGGARNQDGALRCQSRAANPDGVTHRCVLSAAHDRGCYWPPSGAERPEGVTP